jgi:hypothetical protein
MVRPGPNVNSTPCRGDFGDGDTCCFLVDNGVIGSERGGERVQGEVLDRARVSTGSVVDQLDRVIGV